jgi:hypothetical protein
MAILCCVPGNGVFDEDQARTSFWGARQCFGSSRDPIITNDERSLRSHPLLMRTLFLDFFGSLDGLFRLNLLLRQLRVI